MTESEDNLKKINILRSSVDRIFEDTKKIRDEMDRHLKQFNGHWYKEEELKDTESKVFANLLFSNVMTIAPLLTDNRPTWYVQGRFPFMQKHFDLLSVLLEYLWDKLKIDNKILKTVMDALIMKVGILKVSFDPEAETMGELKIENIDPRTFFIAEGCFQIDEAHFCGERKRKNLFWIKQRFPEKGGMVKPDNITENQSKEYDEYNNFATIYEVWMKSDEVVEYYEDDKESKEKKAVKKKKYPNGKMVYFTQDVLLEEKEYVYMHGKPPYVTFYDYESPYAFYGLGEADQIEELNDSLNMALKLMDGYMTLYCNPNWIVDASSSLDPEAIKKDLPAGGNIWVADMTRAAEPLQMVKVDRPNPVLLELINIIPRLMQEVTGATDITKGLVGKLQRQSATEINLLAESSYTRTRQRVRNLETTIISLCHKCLSIIQQFYNTPRSFSKKTDDSIEWFEYENSAEFGRQMMAPVKPEPEPPIGEPNFNEIQEEDDPEYRQQYEDYKRFVEYFEGADTIYADADILVQTNSSLPLDKQSLANLFLKLKELQIVDGQAVLDQLRIPKREEINARMAAMMQQGQAPPMPGPAPMMGQINQQEAPSE
jgi:hypothetical protein